jgi:hypothetical protein
MPDTAAPFLDSALAAKFSKSQRKTLASAGYLVERFAAACDSLRKRVQDGRVSLPSPWREAVADAASAALQGDGWFVLECVFQEDGKLKLLAEMPSHEAAANIIAAWAAKNSDTSAEPLLRVPEGFHFPWWTAFLRVRPLRDFWESELRRSGWEQLVELLPDGWLLDRTPLPPGAVIPRLEITDWSELPQRISPDRNFGIQAADGTKVAVDEKSTMAKLGSRDVLVEFPQESRGQKLSAIFAKQGARVDLVGVA